MSMQQKKLDSESIRAILKAQRTAFDTSGMVSAAVRQARLQRAIEMLVQYNDALCAAMEQDFGGRPAVFSMMNDILGSLGSLKHARDHLASWMVTESRASVVPFANFGATAWVQYQPKGVVGIIGTWNAPVFTLLSPLASVFAAGNRAVLKPSEIAPSTAQMLARAVNDFFSPDELAVVIGDHAVAAAFSEQPWDHLVFTGATGVGKAVMKAASENLVPVTLELGGKSPTLIGRSADIRNAAERIAVGKSANAGQLCVAPDTVWLPEEQLDMFIVALSEFTSQLYPTIGGNPDVVPIINERHFERVKSYLADARERGARIETVGAADTAANERRMPLSLVINPPADSTIVSDEIFGPALVLYSYGRIEDAVAIINTRARPLALYYFGTDQAEQNFVLENTLSGGVSINDVTMHPALHDAPFGGIGNSGMGHYHGREGFLEFSHARAVYKAGQHDPRREWGMLPPYSEQFAHMIRASVTSQ